MTEISKITLQGICTDKRKELKPESDYAAGCIVNIELRTAPGLKEIIENEDGSITHVIENEHGERRVTLHSTCGWDDDLDLKTEARYFIEADAAGNITHHRGLTEEEKKIFNPSGETNARN